MPPYTCWDFHSHSTASDGLLSPEALVHRAADNGVTALALTDHDTLDGLALARETAVMRGLEWVNGVEISVEWEGVAIHLVGLGFDSQAQILQQNLQHLREGRIRRARQMADALARCGIGGAFEGAMRYAGNPELVSRAHFARYLVEKGVCKDVRHVFEHYLVPGKPGYVEHRWASLPDALTWIQASGGVAVIAHPARYKVLSGGRMKRLLAEFESLGGRAIEVVCGSHSPDHVAHFARLARHFGFYASRGSDFHGPLESYCDLGDLRALPEDLKPVWRLLA